MSLLSVATQTPPRRQPNGGSNLALSAAEPTFQVIRRDGSPKLFDQTKIVTALTKAFLIVDGSSTAASCRVHDIGRELTQQVSATLAQVELPLTRNGHHKVVRAHVLHREERARGRAKANPFTAAVEAETIALRMTSTAGSQDPLDIDRLIAVIEEAGVGLDGVAPHAIRKETQRNLYDGITKTN